MTPKRPRGRPPVDPLGSVNVSITLSRKTYDRYCAEALRVAVSVPEIIRRQLGNKNLKNSRPE